MFNKFSATFILFNVTNYFPGSSLQLSLTSDYYKINKYGNNKENGCKPDLIIRRKCFSFIYLTQRF